MELFSFFIRLIITFKLVIGIGAKSIQSLKIRYQQLKSLKGIYYLHKQRSSKIRLCHRTTVQVNLFQKHLFFHQLTNPQYDKRLLMELQFQYMKTCSAHVLRLY